MKSPYKVLHIIEGFSIGGAEKVLLDIIANSDKKKFNHIVMGFENGPLAYKFKSIGVATKIIRKSRSYDLFFLLKLVLFMKRERIDLIHLISALTTVNYAGTAAILARIPFVVAVHGQRTYLVRDFPRRLWSIIQRFSRRIIAVSRSVKEDLINLGIPGAKITVIYNGIDQQDTDESEILGLKEEFGLNTDKLVVGAVGNLRPVKGYDYLLKAFPEVLKVFPNTRLLIVGDGVLRKRLEKEHRNTTWIKRNIEKNLRKEEPLKIS